MVLGQQDHTMDMTIPYHGQHVLTQFPSQSPCHEMCVLGAWPAVDNWTGSRDSEGVEPPRTVTIGAVTQYKEESNKYHSNTLL